jgi:hypothetical protein
MKLLENMMAMLKNRVKVEVSTCATTTARLQLSLAFFFTGPSALHYELIAIEACQNLGRRSNIE